MSPEFKTLNQLWKENGEKPIKVYSRLWPKGEWFFVQGKAPVRGYYGYDMIGDAGVLGGARLDWCVYDEPAKPKLIAWISKNAYENESLEAPYYCSENIELRGSYVRVPWLDQENLEKLVNKK